MLSQETKEYLLKLAQADCDQWQDELARARAISYANAELRQAVIGFIEGSHARAKAAVAELEEASC